MKEAKMKSTSTQAGFAAIEAILILVIVAIIGGTGWFVWHTKQATDQSLTNTASAQPGIAKANKAKTTTKKSATTTPASSTSTKYLIIKEWGVEIPLTSELADAYYLGPKPLLAMKALHMWSLVQSL
ncbi:MAG TPA: hypothetical protein VFH39_00790 [Candidatus Saccharimonadales bacterium]|nr:hypothetical protein [Candidatus Saccharimonadales bacterium]